MKKFKNIVFYFLKKPAFHIYKDENILEISIGWLNFVFAKI